MKNLLIDTNIYTHAFNGKTEVIHVLQRAQKILICAITIGELLSGFKAGSKKNINRAELEEFLDSPRVQLIEIDEDTAEFYSEIQTALKKKGKPIPTNDIWIAATALQYGLKLYTKDQHFKAVPGLVLV
ncbi:MAG: type II toxin-antitoxin system VapC family toxin [bacterium]|nr:type II toxin-antitoxin system VapC family toxin [bacterium]